MAICRDPAKRRESLNMTASIVLAPESLVRWVGFDDSESDEATIASRCTQEVLQAALAHIDGAEVVEATINR
jgi:hypothetical protein